MKRAVILLFLLVFIPRNVFAEEVSSDEVRDSIAVSAERKSFYELRIWDISGFICELSFYPRDYFNVGLGYNWGVEKVIDHHGGTSEYGFIIEYKFKDELHVRSYYDIHGGSAFALLGGSAVMATDFDKLTAGIAPHLGIGFPGGSFKIFYRYNFYLDDAFNCHEVVFIFGIKTKSKEREKK